MSDTKIYEFVVSGKRLKLTRKEVMDCLKQEDPGLIDTHTVEVSGKIFPIKQAFSIATKIDLLDFQTAQARKNFEKMGFKVNRNK